MTDEFSVVDLANSGEHSRQLLTTTRALQDYQREGAGEQNGSSDAKKQSSSSQSESNLLEEDYQQSLTSYSSDLKKSSSSGSIPSSNSQRQQSRSVRMKGDHFDAVKERRRQIEEKRKKELERQMSEKDKRRQRAQEIKRNPTPSKQTPTKLPHKREQETPLITVNSPSPEYDDQKKSKSKSRPLVISTPGIVRASRSPTSPRSPGSPRSPIPKGEGRKSGPPRKASPTQESTSSKTSSISSRPSAKKPVIPPKRVPPKRRTMKPEKTAICAAPPTIFEVVEPTSSEDSSKTDYSSMSIYVTSVNKTKPRTSETHMDTTDVKSEAQQKRRFTQQQLLASSDHSDQRKRSHPNMKFPEKVEMEKPADKYVVISPEITQRQIKRQPKTSAVGNFQSMRINPLEPPEIDTVSVSAPTSRVTTPTTSRSNSPKCSPKRHMSAVVAPTATKESPLLKRKTSEERPSIGSTEGVSPLAPDQLGLQQMTVSTEEEFEQSGSETGSGRLSLEEDPPSCFELRPQEACLYVIYNEGTVEESECYKMPLTDEQVDKVAEIYASPNSLEQLHEIVPKVQEYLDEGITSFKILSAVESDGCRSSFIISSSLGQSSSGSSSLSSISSFDF